MGKHLWVSEDESLEFSKRSWITTAVVFNSIFDRVAEFFLPEEICCKVDCYAERGMDGIDLSAVDKECFNIFYLRCSAAFSKFPDEKWYLYEAQDASRRESCGHVLWEWAEIINVLKRDKRYDPEWISSYQAERERRNQSRKL